MGEWGGGRAIVALHCLNFIVGTGESRTGARGALLAGYHWVWCVDNGGSTELTPQSHLHSSLWNKNTSTSITRSHQSHYEYFSFHPWTSPLLTPHIHPQGEPLSPLRDTPHADNGIFRGDSVS